MIACTKTNNIIMRNQHYLLRHHPISSSFPSWVFRRSPPPPPPSASGPRAPRSVSSARSLPVSASPAPERGVL